MALLTRKRLTGFAAAVLVAAVGTTFAQPSEEVAANRIKAAFLYHFGSFTEWPEHAFPGRAAPFTIGVVDADDVGIYLRELTAQRTIQGRPIRVRRVRGDDPLDDVQLVYFGRGAAPEFVRIANRLAGQPVLLVTDIPGAVRHGSVIDFVIEGDRVRFDVDLDAASSRELRISARMLEVARVVMREP